VHAVFGSKRHTPLQIFQKVNIGLLLKHFVPANKVVKDNQKNSFAPLSFVAKILNYEFPDLTCFGPNHFFREKPSERTKILVQEFNFLLLDYFII